MLMVTKKNEPENDDKDDVVIKRDPEIVKKEKEQAELAKKNTGELDEQDTGGLVKRITDKLAKKITDELTKRKTDELAKQNTQPTPRYSFTWEEFAFLVVLVLAILAPIVLPDQFLNDTQVALFIVAPVMTWFIRLIYLEEKRNRKIK
jgi:hypothetical protein